MVATVLGRRELLAAGLAGAVAIGTTSCVAQRLPEPGPDSPTVPPPATSPATGAVTRPTPAKPATLAPSGLILYAAYESNVVAMDADTGSRLWQYALTSNSTLVAATPGPRGVYFLDDDGYIHLVGGSGALLARAALPDRTPALVVTTPLYLDGKVFVANWNGVVSVLDANSLTAVGWQFDSGGSDVLKASPAGSGLTVFLGIGTYLVAIDSANGQKLWSWHASGTVGSPVIAGQLVLTVLGSGYLVAIDRASGRQVWGVAGNFGSVRVDGGAIYVPQRDQLWCLDLASGARRWSIQVRQDRAVDGPGRPPGAASGQLVGSMQEFTSGAPGFRQLGQFYEVPVGLDPSSGALSWRRADLVLNSASAVVGGRVWAAFAYVANGGNGPAVESIGCLDAATGATRWTAPGSHPWGGPTLSSPPTDQA